MYKYIAIYGAGGLAKDIYSVCLANNIPVSNFIDDINPNRTLFGIEVIGFPETGFPLPLIIAIGDPLTKEDIVNRLELNHCKRFYTLVDRAINRDLVSIGKGGVVMTGAILLGNSTIGDHVTVYSQSTICHDCIIGDYTTITPGVTICGNVSIGKRCYIGAGSTIKNNVSICNDVIIGAGSIVLKDINSPGTYYGSPCKAKPTL